MPSNTLSKANWRCVVVLLGCASLAAVKSCADMLGLQDSPSNSTSALPLLPRRLEGTKAAAKAPNASSGAKRSGIAAESLSEESWWNMTLSWPNATYWTDNPPWNMTYWSDKPWTYHFTVSYDQFSRYLSPEKLLPWWLLPVSSGITVVGQYYVLGFDLKFKRKAPSKKEWWLKAAMTAPMILGALNGWRADIEALLTVGEGQGAFVRFCLAVALWISSSNLLKAMGLWGGFAIQSPVAALQLRPRYKLWPMPGNSVGFPRYPWGAAWLHPLKWLYAAVLFPYLLPIVIVNWMPALLAAAQAVRICQPWVVALFQILQSCFKAIADCLSYLCCRLPCVVAHKVAVCVSWTACRLPCLVAHEVALSISWLACRFPCLLVQQTGVCLWWLVARAPCELAHNVAQSIAGCCSAFGAFLMWLCLGVQPASQGGSANASLSAEQAAPPGLGPPAQVHMAHAHAAARPPFHLAALAAEPAANPIALCRDCIVYWLHCGPCVNGCKAVVAFLKAVVAFLCAWVRCLGWVIACGPCILGFELMKSCWKLFWESLKLICWNLGKLACCLTIPFRILPQLACTKMLAALLGTLITLGLWAFPRKALAYWAWVALWMREVWPAMALLLLQAWAVACPMLFTGLYLGLIGAGCGCDEIWRGLVFGGRAETGAPWRRLLGALIQVFPPPLNFDSKVCSAVYQNGLEVYGPDFFEPTDAASLQTAAQPFLREEEADAQSKERVPESFVAERVAIVSATLQLQVKVMLLQMAAILTLRIFVLWYTQVPMSWHLLMNAYILTLTERSMHNFLATTETGILSKLNRIWNIL